jgi:hypothetical protein
MWDYPGVEMGEANGNGWTCFPIGQHIYLTQRKLTRREQACYRVHCVGFNDYGWELSQFSSVLLADSGASLHNAVSKEQDCS